MLLVIKKIIKELQVHKIFRQSGTYSVLQKNPRFHPSIYSQWTRFESEYRKRKATVEAYKSANYQGECSRYITDFAKRAGIDNKTATDLILVQAVGLEKL
ncbi:hypothetical protein RHAA1_05633 [Aggregatibacter actinomycetemcomitans RhAA1]|nr:hypothetical protein RHAA1_05633 [Aggregatibacter actinomycetemcomitans RhAA1]